MSAGLQLQIGGGLLADCPGGLERYHAELCAGLSARGHGVLPLAVARGAVPEGWQRLAFPAAPIFARVRSIRAVLAPLLRARSPVACHFALHVFPALDQLNAPLIVHFHGPWASESSDESAAPLATAAKRWIEKAVYRRAHRFIVLSEARACTLTSQFGIARERIDVIPGGVDLARFAVVPPRAAARRVLGWPEGVPLVLAVRRLVRRTGVDLLIAALAQNPSLHAIIAGEGSEASNLTKALHAGAFGNRVRAIGKLNETDLATAYAAADLVVMPSRAKEGFGLVAAEALAAGTPVLATPVGGLPEALAGLDGRFLAAAATADALAASLRGLFDGTRALPTAAQCRAAAAPFGWDRALPRILQSYSAAEETFRQGSLAPIFEKSGDAQCSTSRPIADAPLMPHSALLKHAPGVP